MRARIAVALLLVGVAAPASPTAPELTLEGYRTALAEIERELTAEEWDAAHRSAEALRGRQVSDGASRFEADPSVLAATARARDRLSAQRARERLRALVGSLEQRDSASGNQADAQRLARLGREEAGRRPRAGGEIDASLEVGSQRAQDHIRDWLLAAGRWLHDKLLRLLEWLTRFKAGDEKAGATSGAVGVLIAVIAVLLAAATVFSLRRRDPGEAIGEAEVAPSKGDEDPLSRESAEWERYAAELASSGRRREAVRAWYHAVLVALFRAGQIHHQKGRTNWEYVAQASPQAAWRPAFIRLTETFDREWYGREASALDTLRDHAARARDVLRSVRGGEAAA